MSKKVTRICQWKRCRKQFEARSVDVKRGWAKFCSKSCKAKEQENRTGQFRDLVERDDDEDDDCGHIFASGYFGHGQE